MTQEQHIPTLETPVELEPGQEVIVKVASWPFGQRNIRARFVRFDDRHKLYAVVQSPVYVFFEEEGGFGDSVLRYDLYWYRIARVPVRNITSVVKKKGD